MEYFKNVETRVRRTSTGITELPDGYLSNSVVNVPVSESTKPSNSRLAKAAKQKEEMEKNVKDTRNKINKQFNNNKLELGTKKAKFDQKSSEMSKKGKNAIFKRLVTEMYIESLYLDENFVLENFDKISGIVENFIDENGGYSLLENAYEQSKSPLLKKMIVICEETTKRVTARVYKVAEKEQNADLLNFELDSDEKEKFEYDKRDLGLEEISNVVKDKVLAVVKAEKAREQKHEELMEDIENELSENPDVTDEKSIKENLNRILAQSSPTEEGTLFNALLRSTYKSVIEGTAPLFTNEFTVEENFLVDDIDFEDADLDEDISDLPYEEELLEDEEIFEIFDSVAFTVSESLVSDDEDSTEKLEEALFNIKDNIKNVTKRIKSGKKAKTVKKDVRKIQKSTEELEEACNKKKTVEAQCKKKAVESFVDGLDDVVENLDRIIDVHESTIVEVEEAMRKTKDGKTFVQPIIQLNDIKLPDIKFMYKVKAIEKELNKLSKSANNKNVAKNVKKIAEKNMKNIDAMVSKLKVSNDKSKDKKISVLQSLKDKLSSKLSIIKESIDQLDDSIFIEESFEMEFDNEEFIEESDSSVDMDQLLAQTIAKYTLMEMCYTIKLANYRQRDIMNMTHKLLNK